MLSWAGVWCLRPELRSSEGWAREQGTPPSRLSFWEMHPGREKGRREGVRGWGEQ